MMACCVPAGSRKWIACDSGILFQPDTVGCRGASVPYAGRKFRPTCGEPAPPSTQGPRAQHHSTCEVGAWRLAGGVDVEADLIEHIVVQDVATVEHKGRMDHRLVDGLVVQVGKLGPLG